MLTLFAVLLTAGPAAAAQYASIIVEADSGRVLYERNADTRAYPASLTKMMTLYMLFDAMEKGKFDRRSQIPISKHAAAQPPTKLGLRPGSTISVEMAIKALVTRSANDIAAAIGEAIGGTESQFAAKMTAKARQLGMTRTTFRNASGLPNAAQMTTARDIATLSVALRRDFPQYYHYFAVTEFDFKGQTIRTHNRVLLQYDGADGLKTGYIRASGFNLAASAKRGGVSLVGVVLGGKTSRWRDAHMITLLDKGFEEAVKLAALPAPRRKPTAQLASTSGTIVVDSETLEAPPSLSAARTPDTGRPDTAGAVDLTTPHTFKSQSSGWGIQVGAFSAHATALGQAQHAADQVRTTVRGAAAAVTPVSTANGMIYRARVMGLGDERAARTACATLRMNERSCVVVPPAGVDVALGRDTTTTR